MLHWNFRSPERESSPSEFLFEVTASHGAILALPNGASREDLYSLSTFQQQAMKHGKEWDTYAREIRGRNYANGSLCLVTGTDQARLWAMATFTDASHAFGISLKPSSIPAPSSSPSTWEENRTNHGPLRSGPIQLGLANELGENQCIFMRAFWISTRNGNALLRSSFKI